jgi:outer membrane lipopolysaccharide assembly protein LptE/RlpB
MEIRDTDTVMARISERTLKGTVITMKRLCGILPLIPLSLLCGCGFHLAGSEDISNSFSDIILVGNNNDILYKNLKKELLLEGFSVTQGTSDLAAQINGDTPVLSCSDLRNESKALSVSSDSQEMEYAYKNQISCTFFVKGYEPYVINSSLDRSFLNKSGATLSQLTEEETIRQEVVEIFTGQIIFRIKHAVLKPSVKTGETESAAEDEKITVVFNGTGGTTEEEKTEVIEIEGADELKALEQERNVEINSDR